jgi:GNAT superfamily N-acetyltransferase
MPIDVVPLTDPDVVYPIARGVSAHEIPDFPFPTLEGFRLEVAHPTPSAVIERYLGRLDGVPVGHLWMSFPQLDNRDNAEVEIEVLPEYRRRGVGRALYDRAVARVRELGRKRLQSGSVDRLPDGAAFAAAVGASAALHDTRSRLDLATTDAAALDALLASSWRHADGYRAVSWLDAPPDELIDDVAYLDSRFVTDSPQGDLEIEPEQVDAARIRATVAAAKQRGRTLYSSGAVHAASGRLVGFTTLSGSFDIPGHLWQSLTLVDPGHRGHRLGLIIKLTNLAYARAHRPELTAIDTFNASANEHMLAVNRQMGFRPMEGWTQWQQTV